MVEYYVEMVEKMNELNRHKPVQILRKYVADVAEAEAFFTAHKDEFNDFDSFYVEMKHNLDPSLNEPCIIHSFSNTGKVVLSGSK